MKLLDEKIAKPTDQLDAQQLDQLGEILDELLAQAEAGHAPSIEAACERHPELASAIRYYVRSMQLLHNAAHAKAASSSDGSRINLLAPPERQLGDYRLVREIGRGGMGIVYEAEQLSLARRVALKILPFAAVLDGRQIARFQNEAQAAASLHHPHIVPVYAVGHERGTYYYSMQYIDGQTLEFAIDQMRHGREGSLLGLHSQDHLHVQLRNASTIVALGSQASPPIALPIAPPIAPAVAPAFAPQRSSDQPADQPVVPEHAASTIRMADASTVHSVRNRDYVRRVAEIGVQAAEALHYAHQHGIIHRDVKPSNLMLDASGNLWVTDFGLAQCASSNSLTRSGDVIGTLRYMSPEQASGRSHLIDHRTDVYALGATLYELLTLRAVVDAPERVQMLRQIESDSPAGLRRFNSAIPIDLENIVLKAISKSREERYATADELAADLKRFLEGQTPLARRPGWLDHSARWVRRHAKGVAISCLVLMVLLAGTIASAIVLQTKNREIAVANAQAENHLLRANDAVYQFGHSLLHRLELLPGSEELRRDTARDTLAYFQAFASYAHQRSLLQADVARALMVCGDLEMQLGEQAAAIDHYRQSHDTWSRLSTPERFAQMMLCQNNMASAYAELGQLEEARQSLQSTLKAFASLSSRERPQDEIAEQSARALLHMNLGHVLWQLNESRSAQSQFGNAMAILDSIDSAAAGRKTISSGNLAQSSRLQSQVDELMSSALLQSGQLLTDTNQARAMMERALDINLARCQSAPGTPGPVHDLSLSRLSLGAVAMTEGNFEEARRLFQKAVVDLRRLHEQHPAVFRFGVDLASALNNVGQAALEAEDYSQAEQNFTESKSLLERLHRSSDDYWVASNLGGVCNNLAVVKEHQGQPGDAEQLLKDAIEYQEFALSKSPDSARCREFLAEHRAQLARLIQQQP